MALSSCPECNREISDTVRKCPNCGYKIKNHRSKKEPKLLKNTMQYVLWDNKCAIIVACHKRMCRESTLRQVMLNFAPRNLR